MRQAIVVSFIRTRSVEIETALYVVAVKAKHSGEKQMYENTHMRN